MKEFGPKLLREYAKVLEDPRRMVNVENCVRCPELDQRMLLALNGATSERSGYKDMLPEAGTVREWLKDRLIEVSTSDKQDNITLGLFYTNIDPMNRKHPKVAVGVFPRYHEKVKYAIRPLDPILLQEERGMILHQELISEKDPLLVTNSKGPDFLFFETFPFAPESRYKLPPDSESYDKFYYNGYPSYKKPYGLGLERNIIEQALWAVGKKRRPELFRQSGFARFINSHCSDPRYMEL